MGDLADDPVYGVDERSGERELGTEKGNDPGADGWFESRADRQSIVSRLIHAQTPSEGDRAAGWRWRRRAGEGGNGSGDRAREGGDVGRG